MDSLLAYREVVHNQLERLDESKLKRGIEPPLTELEANDLVDQIKFKMPDRFPELKDKAKFALIETVFREKFNALLASTSIDDPSFTRVWSLLDSVAILSDNELCEPGLTFWLVEELLDSQTIDGCRKVFDYLESRREKITAKHFHQKNLIILRSCNELLRRLSRAEDTVLCGRVFIFLFESFDLGDKSSVNLRAEFHHENVTSYDQEDPRSSDDTQPMDVDFEGKKGASDATISAVVGKDAPPSGSKAAAKGTSTDGTPDLKALYPIFWAMQANFSNPTRLFQAENLATFKSSLTATLESFRKVHSTNSTSHVSYSSNLDDRAPRSSKGPHKCSATDFSTTLHTKYLTNRDLFSLELQDTSFRRHILVQALIILDFLLSLSAPNPNTPKSIPISNKAVIFPFTLSPPDTEWGQSTKQAIATYLQQQGPGNEGKFYYRMVDTVLSRDRNWVRWKAEGCPPIQRPRVPAADELAARKILDRIAKQASAPLRPPLAGADLGFLSDANKDGQPSQNGNLEPGPFKVPSARFFVDGIHTDELDAEMGTEEEKQRAKDAATSKLWKGLRASQNRFRVIDKLDGGKNYKALLLGDEDEIELDAPEMMGEEEEKAEVGPGEQNGRDGPPDADVETHPDAEMDAVAEVADVEAA